MKNSQQINILWSKNVTLRDWQIKEIISIIIMIEQNLIHI
jgi:hypothetical protein